MSRRPNRGAALCVAAGGVLLGHWLAYSVASPGAQARSALLARTGHAYLGVADQFGLILALCAFAAIFLGRLVRPRAAAPRAPELVPRLAGFQIAAFLAMEISERLSSGAPVHELLRGPMLPIGVAAQIVVAGCAALAIGWLLRAADRVVEAARSAGAAPPLPRPRLSHQAGPPCLAPAQVAAPTFRGRAPPLSTPR